MTAPAKVVHDIEAANKALEKTRITLMGSDNAVFFCSVMLSMVHIWDNKQPTAYTDGRVIGYNIMFFMGLTPKQRVGLVLHETLHVAFCHVLRAMGLDPLLYNYAADYVINLIIIAAGFELPPGALYDRKYEGMNVEQVYALLPKDMPQPDGFMDDIRDPGDDPGEIEKLREELDDILVQAVQMSNSSEDKPGSVPSEIEFYVESLLNPVIPWNRLMKSFMTKFAKDDYSYKKFNKRYMPILLPSLYSEKVADFAVGTDTSCSVTDKQYGHYVAETMNLLKWLKPDKIHFLQFDTKLKTVYELNSQADFEKVKFTGRGGTNVEPLMKWAEKNRPTCLVVFSDGDFREPKTNPKIPVLWIVHDNPTFKAPFGKVIQFNPESKV